MSDKYAVIGNPVAHSKSPLIHAEFARQTRQDVVYSAIFAPEDAFETVVQRFRNEGGLGLNVTLPFKHRAFALAGNRTDRAQHALAVNTLSFDPGAIRGDNTDGAGLVRDLVMNLGFALRGRSILLMGAGGASYGVAGPLLDEAPAALVVANRTREKAVALCRHFEGLHGDARVLSARGYDDLHGRRFDLVINATSAGLVGDMPALPDGVFAPGALAYDMVYGRATPFLAFAGAAGARTADGLGMLVEQAAESFHVWRGVRPETGAVIDKLRRVDMILWRFTWRLVLVALIALTLVQFWFFASVWYWSVHDPESTAFMRMRLERLREEHPGATLAYRWVPYPAISAQLKRAVIAAEDARFMQHDGFDWEGIRKAYQRNLREGEVVAGGSTITQQLAKNLLLSGERAWWRKAQEAAITVMIELIMDKRRILELYLNVIEWGDGVFGAEAAARHHFGVSAAELGPEQAARLAAMVPSPRRYGPGDNTAYLQRRTQVLLARMNAVRVP